MIWRDVRANNGVRAPLARARGVEAVAHEAEQDEDAETVQEEEKWVEEKETYESWRLLWWLLKWCVMKRWS